ncbi:STAS domain-containing protein [Streptomyces sp. NPDC044571]|uniref:STAS domain-containing protein n=1 Tax=Streptomyces sp. NPDC044571 TaxID=3155371 RepID=UPI003408CFD7
MAYDSPRVQVLLDEDGVRAVVLSGEFDVDSVAPLQEVLAAAAREGARRVVDIAQVAFADSSLLNVLLTAHGEESLVVAGPVPKQFAELLHMSGSEDALDIAPTLAEARVRARARSA